MPDEEETVDVFTVTPAILAKEEVRDVEAALSVGASEVFVAGAPAVSVGRGVPPSISGRDEGGFAGIRACSTFGKAEFAEWAFVVCAAPASDPLLLAGADEGSLPFVREIFEVGRERPKRTAEISMEAVLSLELLESSVFFPACAALPRSSFVVEGCSSAAGLG
ncbi:MAG TPA: hypothetical protein VHC00_10715 [Rhizobiaceae bacterium]|nr:hypothetical protein [Rhizobiaceae bacterium]